MSEWVARLEEWKKQEMWDEETVVTDEKALSQLIYGAISDFAQTLGEDDDDVLDRLANDFVQRTGQ